MKRSGGGTFFTPLPLIFEIDRPLRTPKEMGSAEAGVSVHCFFFWPRKSRNVLHGKQWFFLANPFQVWSCFFKGSIGLFATTFLTLKSSIWTNRSQPIFSHFFPMAVPLKGGRGRLPSESMRTDFHFDQLKGHYGFDEEVYPER